MEEAKASYICEYDPNIPITTEAEPFIIMTDTEVPTMTQIEEYQTLIKQNQLQNQVILLLFAEKAKFLEVIAEKNKEIEALKNTEEMRALIKYEEVIYELLPTNNKAFIFSNVSGLGNEDAKKLREKRMRKKDYDDQTTLLSNLGYRRSHWYKCHLADEREAEQRRQVFSPLHSPLGVRVN